MLRAYGDRDYGGPTSNILWFNSIYLEANYYMKKKRSKAEEAAPRYWTEYAPSYDVKH